MQLQYPAPCDECGKLMRPGTQALYFKRKDGSYGHAHEGDCPKAPAHKPKRRTPGDALAAYDARRCSNAPCPNAVDVTYERGGAPASCHLCGSPWAWTGDEGWAEDVEVAA